MGLDRHGRHGLRIVMAHLSISKIYHSELLSECANSIRAYGAHSNYKHPRFENGQISPAMFLGVAWCELRGQKMGGGGGGGRGGRGGGADVDSHATQQATHMADFISKVQHMTSKC